MTPTARTSTNVLPMFVALQCLDLATTMQFMARGVAEGNPLLTMALPYAHAPWMGLVAAKLTATLVGFCCYRSGRTRILRLANVGYLLIVVWNLATIAALTLQNQPLR